MKTVFITLLFILLIALTRLIPHPPNFTPLLAIALYSGLQIQNNWQKWGLPLGIMVVSDAMIGFHSLMPVTYLSIALIIGLGAYNKKKTTPKHLLFQTTGSALLFFIITNFGVWAITSYYPKTLPGFIECYTMALPFFHNTILSTWLYTGLLIGITVLSKRYSQRTHQKV